jgi:CheY-like chemotaxis protein
MRGGDESCRSVMIHTQRIVPPHDLLRGRPRRWRGLVVEDTSSLGRTTGMILSSLGGQITTAGNGDEAVDIVSLAARCEIGFDLVLIDMETLIMDGLEVARRMRRANFNGSIIATGASEDPFMEDRCLAAGCDEFLHKPVCLESLTRMVQRCCPLLCEQSLPLNRMAKDNGPCGRMGSILF